MPWYSWGLRWKKRQCIGSNKCWMHNLPLIVGLGLTDDAEGDLVLGAGGLGIRERWISMGLGALSDCHHCTRMLHFLSIFFVLVVSTRHSISVSLVVSYLTFHSNQIQIPLYF